MRNEIIAPTPTSCLFKALKGGLDFPVSGHFLTCSDPLTSIKFSGFTPQPKGFAHMSRLQACLEDVGILNTISYTGKCLVASHQALL